MNLFELSRIDNAAINKLQNALIESEGEVTEEVEALMALVEASGAGLGDKIDAYGGLMALWQGEADTLDTEAARLKARATVRLNGIKRLKDNLMLVMEQCGEKKLAGERFTASVCNNGGKAPLVLDTDNLDALPSWAVKLEVKPNNDAIRIALEHGDEIPWAHIEPRGTHLRVS